MRDGGWGEGWGMGCDGGWGEGWGMGCDGGWGVMGDGV